MSFVSKLFALFTIVNIFSANISSGVVFAGKTDTEIHTEVSDNKKFDKNIDKNSKSELKNAGFVSVHSKDYAFSYELDNDGNIKNVKDLLADSKSKSENSDNQNADGICVYSSYSRFEVFSGNGTIEIKESDYDRDLSKKDSGELKIEITKEKLESENKSEKKPELVYEIQDEEIEECNDDEFENEGEMSNERK